MSLAHAGILVYFTIHLLLATIESNLKYASMMLLSFRKSACVSYVHVYQPLMYMYMSYKS